MKRWLIILSQICNTAVWAENMDTLIFQMHGLIDGYSTLGKTNPLGKVPYLVSSSNLNSFQINLNVMEFTLENSKWKYALSPAIGSYMQQNYAAEKGYKRWIYEMYVQRKFNQSSIAAGVFSSPYTQETPKSGDQLSYSRSLAPEYVPYYISGLKYQRTLSSYLNLSLFAMNGWQKMNYDQFSLSFGSLLEFKKGNWKVNWSTYIGREKPTFAKELQTRMLSEWNMQYSKGKWTIQSCAFVGTQGINFSHNWWQINTQLAFLATAKTRLYGRVEYFSDLNTVQLSTGKLASESMGVNYALTDVMSIGTEFRCFHSEKKAFEPYQFLFFQLKF
ncbi:MAG: outer membrane beta-barrel protein [Flavobacteriia bacterium]|jgi:hypothetical protein